MNQEIKAQWVADLRSGEYRQGRHQLATGDYYCCLGVLCEQAVKAGIVTRRDNAYFKPDDPTDGPAGPGWDLYLPPVVMEWAGLDDTNPIVPGSISLGSYNDQGQSFEYIADLIERDL